MSEPTGILAEILEQLDEPTKTLLLEHIVGGTPATWISAELTKAGYKISATTIKEQRARLRND